MVDSTQLLMLPLELCRDVRLIGGTALATKAMLVLEAARTPYEATVTMPMARLADAIGARTEHVRAAIKKLHSVQCATRSRVDGEWESFDVLDPEHTSCGLGRGAVVTMRTADEWRASCDTQRTVPVPLREVREMTTRTGLLTRLRVGALLHGRDVPSDPRVRIRADAIPDYTGYDGNGGRTMAYTNLLVPGVNDLNETSESVEVRLQPCYRDGTSKHPWLKHVNLRVTPLSRQARSRHVHADARAAELAE